MRIGDGFPLPLAALGGANATSTAERTETTDAESTKAHGAAKAKEADSARVAREFEAIFLRKMLSSLEKTSHFGNKGPGGSGGAEVYGSMVVGAMADAIANSGGMGLAQMLTTAMAGAPSHAKDGGAASGSASPPRANGGGLPLPTSPPAVSDVKSLTGAQVHDAEAVHRGEGR
jgi:Rod binding domain-containing protein